ncbi:MAG: hypothetical protein ACT4PZ_11300 [Panacagrimonas sp.]
MNRVDLGRFGAGLTQGELAQALTALGVLLSVPGAFPINPTRAEIFRHLRQLGEDGFLEVASWWLHHDLLGYRTNRAPAEVLADCWRSLLVQQPRPRVEVQEDGDPVMASWMAEVCRHPDVDAGSVYLRMDTPDWPVAWDWPLRIGVLGAPRSAERREWWGHALGDVGYRKLWEMVDMEQPGAECELLIFPGDLRRSLAKVLNAPYRPRTDCVLVLGGTQLPDDRGLSLKTALRQEARAAGVAILRAGVPLHSMLTELIRELSHDATLDVALFSAVRNTYGERRRMRGSAVLAPDLLFSRTLATRSSVRVSAARTAHQFSAQPQELRLERAGLPRGFSIEVARPASTGPRLAASNRPDPVTDSLARSLQDRVKNGPWSSEGGDASDLVDAHESIVLATGQRHRRARMSGVPTMASALPPQPVDEIDDREVLAQVIDENTQETTVYLQPARLYHLAIKISPPQSDFIGAGAPFPSDQLPSSESGHRLDVTFVPLDADADDGERSAPQQRQIFLPPQGPSTSAEFTFYTRTGMKSFYSRLLVSYENRVIQTLRLNGKLNSETQQSPYSFAIENVVQPGFHNLAYQAPFDAALVVNHSSEGQAGITMLSGSSVVVLEPAGMGEMMSKLQEALTDETALRRAESSLDSEAMTNLIYGLAQHGRLLYDYIESQLGSLDGDAGRIQIVEARPGAYFPAEFIYPIEVPPAKPPLCPQAAEALSDSKAHQSCPNRDDPEHLCPVRFWGFRKQIERQTSGIVPSGGTSPTITVPTPLNGKLDLARSAQVAKSDRVQAADYDLPDGLLKVLKHCFDAVGTPSDWKQWKGLIAEQSPGFLLLLSHSTEDAISHLPALEISKDLLPVASLETSYVKGPNSTSPVVFLMGCSTADPKVGFLNFVERFKRKQAALVVGTLSTISAQRAARFLALALPMFNDPKNKGRMFGEVFLEVKRVALAKGDGFAMSLVAYGDMSWQL